MDNEDYSESERASWTKFSTAAISLKRNAYLVEFDLTEGEHKLIKAFERQKKKVVKKTTVLALLSGRRNEATGNPREGRKWFRKMVPLHILHLRQMIQSNERGERNELNPSMSSRTSLKMNQPLEPRTQKKTMMNDNIMSLNVNGFRPSRSQITQLFNDKKPEVLFLSETILALHTHSRLELEQEKSTKARSSN